MFTTWASSRRWVDQVWGVSARESNLISWHFTTVPQNSIFRNFGISKFSMFFGFLIFFSKIFRIFFKKIIFELFSIFFSISKKNFFVSKKNIKIRNLFRNPKIILRKSCEHFKGFKNPESKVLKK